MPTPRSPIEFTKEVDDGSGNYQRVGNQIDIASITTTDLLPVDIQALTAPNPFPTDDQEVTEGSWTEILASTVITSTAAVNSSLHDVDGYTGLMVKLFIQSTLTPTDITFIPQYSDDGGSTWGEFLVGIWASMVFEDTLTASPGITRYYVLDVDGIDDIRIQVLATGVDVSNTFTVSIDVRGFR